MYLGRRQLESLNSSVAACYVSVISRAGTRPQLQFKETKHPLFVGQRKSGVIGECHGLKSIRLMPEL